jgi:hypothetical protein
LAGLDDGTLYHGGGQGLGVESMGLTKQAQQGRGPLKDSALVHSALVAVFGTNLLGLLILKTTTYLPALVLPVTCE